MEQVQRPILFGCINLLLFGAIYLFGRKWHPQTALVLCLVSFVVMTVLSIYQSLWLGASVILCFVYMAILKKPDLTVAFQRLYTNYHLQPVSTRSSEAFNVLGDKKWKYAAGTFVTTTGRIVPYSFWQGHTVAQVSAGEYTRSTTFTYYLAFVFAPGAVTTEFKQRVTAAADRSGRSRKQKLVSFFSADTETPERVITTGDGTFIVEYVTLLEPAYYERRLAWMKEHL